MVVHIIITIVISFEHGFSLVSRSANLLWCYWHWLALLQCVSRGELQCCVMYSRIYKLIVSFNKELPTPNAHNCSQAKRPYWKLGEPVYSTTHSAYNLHTRLCQFVQHKPLMICHWNRLPCISHMQWTSYSICLDAWEVHYTIEVNRVFAVLQNCTQMQSPQYSFSYHISRLIGSLS